jgi:hypothetical protein
VSGRYTDIRGAGSNVSMDVLVEERSVLFTFFAAYAPVFYILPLMFADPAHLAMSQGLSLRNLGTLVFNCWYCIKRSVHLSPLPSRSPRSVPCQEARPPGVPGKVRAKLRSERNGLRVGAPAFTCLC